MMARKDIDYTSPDVTPVKKIRKKVPKPKRPEWYFDSPLKKVTRDLFGTPKKEKPNTVKGSLFYVRTLNTNIYKLTGTKKRMKSPKVEVCNANYLYTKRLQDKETHSSALHT